MELKPIDTEKYRQRAKEEQRLLAKLANAIYDYLDQAPESLKYYNYAVEYWKLTTKNSWDDIIEKILTDKLNYLSPSLERYYTKLQLDQKTFYPGYDQNILKELDLKIAIEKDTISRKRLEIDYFYKQQNIKAMAGTIKMTQEEITKAGDQMLKNYNIIIQKQKELKNLLQLRVDNNSYEPDQYEAIEKEIKKVRDEIEIMYLNWEIEAKNDFANVHFRERSTIFTKILQKINKDNEK